MGVSGRVSRRPVLDDRFLGAVLAGGASRRFGSPKERLQVDGHTMAERAVVLLRSVCAEVVALSPDAELFVRYGVETVPDRPAGIGPLGGLHAALLLARERGLDGVLVLAADLPFMTRDVLRLILDRAHTSPAPAVALEDQPLCALYRVEALPVIEARIARDKRAIRLLLAELDAAVVSRNELRGAGIPERALLNVNRPEDLPPDVDVELT